MKIRTTFNIVVVKARFQTTCAGEGCDEIIEKGMPCHARRPGKQYFCSSCAKQFGWPIIDKDKFANILEGTVGNKRKHREAEVEANKNEQAKPAEDKTEQKEENTNTESEGG